ncbi:FtsK/SpoIIIE domain-containing protein [Brevibacillus fulvus]|uniref:S-DNA-T family DNA segregation ATPase FtsK/SpoIIIE n=1 Tax=Brevibacillus fulvus TaxID=1125967 RepID=A0A938Y4N0_9BACL|nr:FtsK/SpoIIIE domain-containing protein [Brevibacillus fulvus]MBM7592229.1 S-DNA-T family DNA segregation ATPase FtsK/SpoIIIE [Brevibacillus fulvus]
MMRELWNSLKEWNDVMDDFIGSVMFELFGATFVGIPSASLGKPLSVLTKMIAGAYIGANLYTRLPSLLSKKAQVRYRLTNSFLHSGLFLTIKRRDIGDGQIKEVRVFPKINDVKIASKLTEVRISLPLGMAPEMIQQREWAFQRTFGDTTQLIEDSPGHYRLRIPAALPDSFRYDYEQARTILERTGGFPVYVGESSEGPVAINLQKTPHIGIVGVTGWGKSSLLRIILNSWLRYYSPDRLRLFLADLKMSEFGMYERVPHVEGRVAVRKHEVRSMLSEVHEILLARQEMFYNAGAIDQEEYEEMTGEKLPFIVVAIDEVAALRKETEIHDVLDDIAAMGRSLGVFLILSQQRADKEVIDGRLKNNLNIRIAFRMSDELNSRMFLENGLAAKIKVKGRSLVKDTTDLLETQTPWLDTKEARAMIAEIKDKYRDHRKKPLLVKINGEVPQDVELNAQDNKDLLDLVMQLQSSKKDWIFPKEEEEIS